MSVLCSERKFLSVFRGHLSITSVLTISLCTDEVIDRKLVAILLPVPIDLAGIFYESIRDIPPLSLMLGYASIFLHSNSQSPSLVATSSVQVV